MERLTQREKNKRFMAERVALIEYMEKTGTDPDEMRRQFFAANCIKENIPGWAAVMGSPSDDPTGEEAEPVEVSEVIPNNKTGVPEAVTDGINDRLEEYKARFDIPDLKKCSALQWSAACQYVGFWLNNQDYIHDREFERHHGGKKYNADNIIELLQVWALLCGANGQVPIVTDFIYFTGVGSAWFYDSDKRLTSSSVDLLKRVREIEEGGLNAVLNDKGRNPVGAMFKLKAKHGYRETSEVIHTTEKRPLTAAELPRLGTSDS